MAERRSRDVLIWSATIAVMALVLLAPALWNGFPLIYPDTGGYLERPLLGTLEMGRSALYGAFLLAGAPLSFWPNIAIQALIIAWLIFLVLRAHDLARPGLALAIVIALALTTSLPWFASQLMPDVLFPGRRARDLSADVSRSDAAPFRTCRAGHPDHLRGGLPHGRCSVLR